MRRRLLQSAIQEDIVIVEEDIKAGDVAYYDGGNIKTCRLSNWDSSKGTPIGVVVVPSGFAPDGKTRIISLNGVDSSGNSTTSENSMKWCSSASDTALTNYTRVPNTDNNSNSASSSGTYGYLPSDNFTSTQSYVDKLAYYNYSRRLIPSPYICDTEENEAPNPAFYQEISGYSNALSDFDGLSSTQTLVELGSSYTAANACWNYKDNASNLQWYLPAIGEFCYAACRQKRINETLSALGGVSICTNTQYHTATEYSSSNIYTYIIQYGAVDYYYKKTSSYYVRPFAIID